MANLLMEAALRLEAVGVRTGSAKNSAKIMKEAPVVVILSDTGPVSKEGHNSQSS